MFFVYKIIAAQRSNRFHKMRFSWGSPACSLLPIPSKAEQSLRDLYLNPIFSRSKKWTGVKKPSNKQTNNPAKTHEHRWAPMNAHEDPGAPMNSNVFCDFWRNPFFFHTNVVCKLYVQPLSSQLLIYHLGCLVLHFFNSRMFFLQTCFFFLNMCVSLHPVLVWHPEKKLSTAIVAPYVYVGRNKSISINQYLTNWNEINE